MVFPAAVAPTGALENWDLRPWAEAHGYSLPPLPWLIAMMLLSSYTLKKTLDVRKTGAVHVVLQ